MREQTGGSMNPIEEINEPVKVIASYDPGVGERGRCIPRRMMWRGKEFTFTELGLYHPTSKGQHMIHVYDVADNENSYRLEDNAKTRVWRLIYVMAGHQR